MIEVIVRECDADHKDDRQCRKYEDSKKRKGQKGFVKILVQKGVQILSVGRKVFSFFQKTLRISVIPQVQPPHKDQGDDHDYGKKTVQQDKEAVVAVRNRSVGIESSSLCSQGQKVLQVIHAKSEDEPEHTAFQRQKCDSSCILTP